jgi:alkyldihydroxyacetonephosphate synthase
MPFTPERGAPTAPIALEDAAGATARLAARRVEVDAGVLRRLTDVCATVSTDSVTLAESSRDWWPLAMHWALAHEVPALAAAVARPGNASEVAAVVRVCADARLPLTVAAGRSGVCGASIPVHGGVVLDLCGLEGIVDVDRTSMIVDVRAGTFGDVFEDRLRAEHALTCGHWPQSIALSTVGGWLACRGAGQLSTRYGKIEDIVAGLDVVLADGSTIHTGGAPRAAVGPDLTQLFVGSEGTLGVITRATLQVVPLPAVRRFAAVAFPSVSAGIGAMRRTLQLGHRPSVIRMYDEEATRLTFAPVVGEDLSGVYTVLAFEGEAEAAELEERRTLAIAGEAGAHVLDPALGQRWWDRRYDFYHPPHQPELPAIWGTLDVVATYARIEAVYEALHSAVREPYRDTGLQLRMHFSHWYAWGTMIYGRFVVPDGGPDALALHDRIWEDGMTAALDAGAVINDHHGVGIKLGPYMRRQHGAALDSIRRIKSALDPHDVMNPGKLGL